MDFFNWYGKSIVLASKSPRRAEILRLINLDFSIHYPNYIEDNQAKTDPATLVTNHAISKAKIVAPDYDNSWIISADTVVVMDDTILGKPKDRNHAIEILKLLSGKTHMVYTGYCVMNSSNSKFLANNECTEVAFLTLTNEMIEFYIDNFQPYDKAGAYAIQDFSAIFIESIRGCFYNVVGFPLPAFFKEIMGNLINCL